MIILILIIVLALLFDFINGFHDAANSIATIVTTKVLTPFQAVLWAAFFNFMAYWVFHLNVADTIAKTVDTAQINLIVILAGVIAAIIWNLATWWLGIPSSSSHTLIGGFAGAAVAHAGFGVVKYEVLGKIVAFIFLAPIIGMVISFFISLWFLYSTRKDNHWIKAITWIIMISFGYFLYTHLKFDAPKGFFSISDNIKYCLLSIIVYSISIFTLYLSKMSFAQSEYWFKKLQLVSSGAFSLGHGGNDSQKVMGIIAAAILVYVSQNHVDMDQVSSFLHVVKSGDKIEKLPTWLPLACYSAIAIGTMSGGWKIVKTMGSKITKVTPFEGVAAESAGAITLFLTEALKVPVSTTHTITGSIIGCGMTKRISAVRWGVTTNLLWAWVLTIPVSATIAAIIYFIFYILGIHS